jgi:hypothetical protein
MKKALFALLTVCIFALLFVSPSATLACACCAEEWTYSINFQAPEKYNLDLLKEMKFGPSANLFITEGEDTVKGLNSDSEKYDLSGIFTSKTWKLNFKDEKGKNGSLSLPLPAKMLTYKVDIHDGKEDGGGGPLLYKELRFEGQVSGTGFFKSGIIAPTKYFLVFQGRGNNCDNASDFTHWQLVITGKKADYAFFGKMGSNNGKRQ